MTRSKAPPQRLHPGSLLRIPLASQMLRDSGATLTARAIDLDWAWREALRGPRVGGFRPFFGEILYPVRGGVSKWVAKPTGDARDLNVDDALIHDVLFMVHDYLHVWSYAILRELSPRCVPGFGKIRPQDIEDLTFLHLVTEACATVGLDYWYLCTVDLNEVCDLGTGFRALTVSYHERWASEAKRVCPGFEAQSPEFFEKIATFYGTGEFLGFDTKDLKRSPRLYRWLSHEVRYGRMQRIFARQWLKYMAGLDPGTNSENDAPVDVSARWKRSLLREVGTLLWEKVKEDKLVPTPRAPVKERWATSSKNPIDFRFVNIASLSRDELQARIGRPMDEQQFDYFCAQYVSGHDFASFDKTKLRFLQLARDARDARAIVSLLEGAKRIPNGEREPRDVLFLN